MTYEINDTVLYGIHGVCRIEDIRTDPDGTYYVLKPVYDEKATLFVPKGNERLEKKMRRILSAEEIHQLIREMPEEESIWIQNEAVRKEKYKKILAEGDRRQLIQMIKTLYLRQQSQADKGKKLYKTDEKFMHDAEKMLYEEFAHVLSIQPEQVVPFITQEIHVALREQP